MKLKKWLASCLTVCMMLSTLGMTSFATSAATDVWDGTADTSWYNTEAMSFELTTAEQLAGFADLVDGGETFAGKTILLQNNLDLKVLDENGENISFDPIGYGYGIVFKGTFDGGGHTISNLYQNGWALGLDNSTEGGGLFASVVDATIKNLNIDNAEIVMECIDMGIVVGYSYGTCHYENINITNSLIANYNRYTGGVVGEINGTQTFKNVDVANTTTISTLWGSFDTSLGGIIGGKWGDATVTFEDCDVACEINAFNDATSAYEWFSYRRCGMLIGNTEDTKTENGHTIAIADFVTAINCTVTYGDWANYTYCSFGAMAYPYVRVQEGYSNSAYYNARYGNPIDANGNTVTDENHVHNEGEAHHMLLVFNQLYGGGQGVYGNPVEENVTITDNAIVARSEAKIVGGEGEEDVYYSTLQEAIDAAEADDTIALVKTLAASDVVKVNKNIKIDLAEKTLSFATPTRAISLGQLQVTDGADVKIDNGIIDFTGAGKDYNVQIGKGTLTLGENVMIIGDGFSGNAFCLLYPESKLIMNGTKVNISNQEYQDGTYFIKAEPDFGYPNVIINNADITITNGQGFINNSIATIENSKINLVNMAQHGLRNVSGTITDTQLSIDTKEDGIKNNNGKCLTIGGESIILIDAEGTAYKASSSELAVIGGKYSVDPSSFVTNGMQAEKGAVLWGIVVDKNTAEKVYVQFKKTDLDADGKDTLEKSDTFDIVLAGYESQKINELASADLTFAFDGKNAVSDGAMSYSVTSAKDVTLSKTGKSDEADRYMFNFDGIEKHEETDEVIVIGHITVTGYGTYSLSVAEKETNAVYATTITDNLVNEYTAAATLVINEDMVLSDGMVGEIKKAEIKVPTRNLTISVTFPNAVKKNAADYQKMSVKIEGGNIKKELALGDATYTETADVRFPATVTPGEGYVITADLPYNTTYTVTVSGAGYRTATYSVVLTDGKTLTFWNNVMDDMTAIEKGNANSETTKTFLAGDIVKDNKINVYDLSAVVSYFGKVDLTTIPNGADFAKYDLDRDGKIDAKDVAYVLVSWNE